MKHAFDPFQKVLVRVQDEWVADFFSHKTQQKLYVTITGKVFRPENILPFNDETKELLGTKKKLWNPTPNELVAVRKNDKSAWVVRKFASVDDVFYYCFSELGAGRESWLFCEPLRDHFNVPEE